MNGLIKDYKGNYSLNCKKKRVLKLRVLAFSRGPGGFRELKEAGRKHFHLPWYLFDAVVAS